MGAFQVCVCYLVRSATDGRQEVLLGRKKRGLGMGKVVGLGGKLEAGEAPVDAAVREVAEESGVIVRADHLLDRGRIRYSFPFRPEWSQESQVYVARAFSGEPEESDEIDPWWYPVDQLPTESMWDDARHWLPGVLAGKVVDAWFEFGEDCETVSDSRIRFRLPR